MKNAMNRVVFEYKNVWYQTDYRFYEERLRHIVLPDGTLLEHQGSAVGKYMLSIPPEAFGFREVEHSAPTEEIASVYNATSAIVIENPFENPF